MKLLCYTLFKTGTHSLRKLFKQTFCDSEYEIEHKHIHNLKKKDFDIIFITVRSHLDIYPSAFFQDITKPQYEYSYFRKDINKNIEYNRKYYNNNQKKILKKYSHNPNLFTNELIKYFLKMDWTKYQNINYKFILNYLNQIIEENMENIQYTKNGYKIIDKFNIKNNKNIKIVFIDISMLNQKEKLIQMLNELNLKYNIDNLKSTNSFQGNQKWYKNIYKNFKKYLKETNYYDKYKDTDLILQYS